MRAWKRVTDRGGRSFLSRSRADIRWARSATACGAPDTGTRNRVVAGGGPTIASLPLRAARHPTIAVRTSWSAGLAPYAQPGYDLVMGLDRAVRHRSSTAALRLRRS